MQKEDPAAGPKLGVWVGSCLIPGEHKQNGEMVILGIGTVSGMLWASLGEVTEGGAVPLVFFPKTTSVWEFALMWEYIGGSQ